MCTAYVFSPWLSCWLSWPIASRLVGRFRGKLLSSHSGRANTGCRDPSLDFTLYIFSCYSELASWSNLGNVPPTLLHWGTELSEISRFRATLTWSMRGWAMHTCHVHLALQHLSRVRDLNILRLIKYFSSVKWQNWFGEYGFTPLLTCFSSITAGIQELGIGQ